MILCLALLAVYGLTSLALAALVAAGWRAGIGDRLAAADDLLATRLLPAAGAALVTVTVALPAFLIHEPAREAERTGPVVAGLVIVALAAAGAGTLRAWRAWRASRAMMDEIGCTRRNGAALLPVSIVDAADPPAAVVGLLRPRVIVARQVVGACSADEFRMVLAHEGAHITARDNLKLLLLVAAPDPLAWLPAGRAIAHRWRRAAEIEADQRAAGADRGRRLALASALIKVARLATARRPPGLDLRAAFDDVDGRVQRLLSVTGGARRPIAVRIYVACAALVPAVSIPLYASVHRLIEALVAFGR